MREAKRRLEGYVVISASTASDIPGTFLECTDLQSVAVLLDERQVSHRAIQGLETIGAGIKRKMAMKRALWFCLLKSRDEAFVSHASMNDIKNPANTTVNSFMVLRWLLPLTYCAIVLVAMLRILIMSPRTY